jgi:hypothetical protein
MTDPEQRQLAERELEWLRDFIALHEGSHSLRASREFARVGDGAALERQLDAIWDAIVNRIRSCYHHDPVVGEEAASLLKRSGLLQEIWPVIQASGLFSGDDDRIATVETFLALGAFVFALDDPDEEEA